LRYGVPFCVDQAFVSHISFLFNVLHGWAIIVLYYSGVGFCCFPSFSRLIWLVLWSTLESIPALPPLLLHFFLFQGISVVRLASVRNPHVFLAAGARGES